MYSLPCDDDVDVDDDDDDGLINNEVEETIVRPFISNPKNEFRSELN